MDMQPWARQLGSRLVTECHRSIPSRRCTWRPTSERGVGAQNLSLPPGAADAVAASVARHLAVRATTAVPSAHDEL
eukprot:scaffold5232_cov73-Phaeocystis_antarctica.AAC.2